MSKMKVGKTEWNSGPDGEKKGFKDSFLRLNPGSNIVRILTAPYQYYQHKYKIEGEKGYGHRITCTADKNTCAVCAVGDKPKRRWLLGVIDRKSNTYKILDIGWSIYKSIETLTNDEDWSNPEEYDIDIVVDPNGGATNFYNPISKRHKPLTAQDLQIRDNADFTELERRTASPEASKVREKFEKVLSDIATANPDLALPTLSKEKSQYTSKTTQASDDEDFEDFDGEERAPF